MLDPDIRKLLDTVFVDPPDATAPDVQALRASAESAPALLGEPPENVTVVRDVLAAGTRGRRVPLRLYDPSPGGTKPLVLFAHGGGWVTGSLDSHDRLCRMLANRLDAVVASVGYACAPEHRYPAALDDMDAAWHWCKEEARALHADSSRMAVAGDSAGGNLAAALTIRLRARREAQPVLQLLLYPAVDARASSESYDAFATGHNLSADMMRWYWKAYAPNADPDDPELAPLAARDHSRARAGDRRLGARGRAARRRPRLRTQARGGRRADAPDRMPGHGPRLPALERRRSRVPDVHRRDLRGGEAGAARSCPGGITIEPPGLSAAPRAC